MIVHILLVYLVNLFRQHQNQARKIDIIEVVEYEVALMKNTKTNQEKSKLKRYLQLPVITKSLPVITMSNSIIDIERKYER